MLCLKACAFNTNNNGLKNNNNKVYTPDKGRSPSLNKKDK